MRRARWSGGSCWSRRSQSGWCSSQGGDGGGGGGGRRGGGGGGGGWGVARRGGASGGQGAGERDRLLVPASLGRGVFLCAAPGPQRQTSSDARGSDRPRVRRHRPGPP